MNAKDRECLEGIVVIFMQNEVSGKCTLVSTLEYVDLTGFMFVRALAIDTLKEEIQDLRYRMKTIKQATNSELFNFIRSRAELTSKDDK